VDSEEAMKPTHKVSFYLVHCYLNNNTGELWGINCFHELLIPLATNLHNFFCDLTVFFFPDFESEGFPFKVLETYNEIESQNIEL